MELEVDETNEEALRDLLGCKCKRSDTPSPFKENLKEKRKKGPFEKQGAREMLNTGLISKIVRKTTLNKGSSNNSQPYIYEHVVSQSFRKLEVVKLLTDYAHQAKGKHIR